MYMYFNTVSSKRSIYKYVELVFTKPFFNINNCKLHNVLNFITRIEVIASIFYLTLSYQLVQSHLFLFILHQSPNILSVCVRT